MSVENPETSSNNENEVKPQNGEPDQRFNGLTNGHIENNSSSGHKHKSSSKDKHRDKDREHKSSKSSSNRDKESDKHKSSSSSDKHRSDRDKEKHRDKDKERSKDKDRHHKDRERDKHKSSSSHHKSSKDKDKDKERSDKDKERSDKDKERKDKDKEKTKDKEREHRDKEKHRDKNKERSKDHKSSGDADKDKKKEHKSSSHGKDRDKERSNKDKDHHHKSSSSKDKHSSSSSKSKDKDRHHSSSTKDRHRDKEKEKKEKHEVKQEVEAPRNDYDQSCSAFPIKEEDDNKFIVPPHQYKEEVSMNFSQASSCDYSMSQFRDDEPAFIVKEEMPDESQIEENIQNNVELRIKNEEDEADGENYNDDEEEYIPASNRKRKQEIVEEEEDPLALPKKPKTEKKKEKKAKKKKYEVSEESEDDYMDEKPKKKKIKKEKVAVNKTNVKVEVTQQQVSPTKGGKKKKEEQADDVWKWWEEEKRDDGVKWTFLEHRGPVFAPDYVPIPNNVHFYYDGKKFKLSQDAEEIASFYAKMLTHDYVTKKQFNDNFFKDWRKSMTSKEKELIKDLSKCNFKEMNDYFTAQSEKRKQMSKEEKQAIKEENEKLIQEYGYCTIDGHKQRIGNFKLEPPGLFRGRGEHPKMGLVKRRLMPEDILINCSKDSKIPVPPKGHKWKEVRHDNSVTWLASWTENVQGQVKYIMLNPSSKLKGEKDFQKYETARRLDKHIDKIRATYREEWKSKEMRIRQRGVALYFIDKLALRAGNEKDDDQADTVGCCSLRVEHVKLKKSYNGKENVVIFDFLGKDSIRYYNEVEVEKRVFKNLELFMENKKEGDDLFDRLNTMVLNEHLRELMEGLTAKVFRTYNASITLQQQLDLLTDPDSTVPEKLLSYNRANRAVAILCNHQRSIPKSHEKSMENLKEKIRQRREQLENAEDELKDLQKLAKRGSVKEKLNADKKKKQVERLKDQLKKLELQQTDRDENKTIALGTSKLNYLDPRISVAWCKKFGVPIEKIFNKTQREKFRWAIDMADEDYRF